MHRTCPLSGYASVLECAPRSVNVTVRKPSSRPREYLTEREVEKLIDTAGENRWGHRDATAILVAYRHGLRASEVVSLRWDDIDFTAGKLHLRRAKGGAASVHPIGGRELRALRALGAAERGRLSAHGRKGRRGGRLPVPRAQPHAAAFVRLQATMAKIPGPSSTISATARSPRPCATPL